MHDIVCILCHCITNATFVQNFVCSLFVLIEEPVNVMNAFVMTQFSLASFARFVPELL